MALSTDAGPIDLNFSLDYDLFKRLCRKGFLYTMAEQPRSVPNAENKAATKDNLQAQTEIVSLARRRAMMAGLAVPIILTLKSKPLFAQQPNGSVSMSANVSRGIFGNNGVNGANTANGNN